MDLYRHQVIDGVLSVVVHDDHTITVDSIRDSTEITDVHALVEALIQAKVERDHHNDEHAFFGDYDGARESNEGYITAMEIIDAAEFNATYDPDAPLPDTGKQIQ